MKSDISKTGIFKYLSIRIFNKKSFHHTSRRSDELPSQKNILQAEGLACASAAGTGDLLLVFCFPSEVHHEQQKSGCKPASSTERSLHWPRMTGAAGAHPLQFVNSNYITGEQVLDLVHFDFVGGCVLKIQVVINQVKNPFFTDMFK